MSNQIPTYDELITRPDIGFIAECDGYLYYKLPAREYYDDTIWKVEKKTHEVSYMSFVDYLTNIDNRATYIFAVPGWLE